MVRAPCCDKIGLTKGAWTKEEDQILKAYVEKNGPGNWRILPKKAGLLRCGKSCRFRWTNYLRPDIKLGNYSREEEETIISLHAKFGNRWSQIAVKLPGRTDNEIKNVWHTHLKKRQKQGSAPHGGSRIHLELPVLKPDTSIKNTIYASSLELSEEIDFSPSTESHSLADHSSSHVSDIGSCISSTSLHAGEEPGLNRGPYDDHDCCNNNEEDISSFWIKILMKLHELPNC